jgi:hypothetical protein
MIINKFFVVSSLVIIALYFIPALWDCMDQCPVNSRTNARIRPVTKEAMPKETTMA